MSFTHLWFPFSFFPLLKREAADIFRLDYYFVTKIKVEFKLKLFNKFIDRKYAASTVKHNNRLEPSKMENTLRTNTHSLSFMMAEVSHKEIVRSSSYPRMHRAITFLLEITIALEMYHWKWISVFDESWKRKIQTLWNNVIFWIFYSKHSTKALVLATLIKNNRISTIQLASNNRRSLSAHRKCAKHLNIRMKY